MAWRARHPGRGRLCPACGLRVGQFAPYGVRSRPDAQCPRCGSLERHRALMLFLREDPAFIAGGLRVLAVAPDPFLERLGRRGLHEYLSIDLNPGKAMAVMDLTRLELPSADRDLVIAFHVLEHIEDDGAAMREIRRVVSPTGRGLIEVPLEGDETDERFMREGPQAREAAYGQADHVRLYGRRNFEDRLRQADLIPEAVAVKERFAASLARASLDPNEVFYLIRPGNGQGM